MKTILKPILMTGLLSILSTGLSANECEPNWCSSPNLTPTETIICSDTTLKAADTLMNSVYSELMGYKGKEGYEGMWYREVYSNQKDWLQERDALKTRSELTKSYLSRTQDLYRVFRNIVPE